DVDECIEATSCGNHSICNNTDGSFFCTCLDGFIDDDGNCTDINECALGTDVCQQNCTNTLGSYECACNTPVYYLEDDVTCVLTVCNSSIGCTECVEGYTGANCDEDIDECANDAFICGIGGNCTNEVGSYQCNCSDGYELNLGNCTLDGCQNGAACENTGEPNGFFCNCSSIGEFNGTYCEININACTEFVPYNTSTIYLDKPCLNNGTCNDAITGYTCSCPDAFSGIFCEIGRRVNSCKDDPCGENVDCTLVTNPPFYSCGACLPGYTNDTCEIDLDECSNSDLNDCCDECECENTKGSYKCKCPPGQKLDADERSCKVCNCSSPAACNASVGCTECLSGFKGANCDEDIDECSSNPCTKLDLGAGVCNNTRGSYVCECAPGYEGDLCDHLVDVCASFAEPSEGCQHNANCSNTGQPNGYECTCVTPDYTGVNCATDVDACVKYIPTREKLDPCYNGATCVDAAVGYTCNCPSGFTGLFCESKLQLLKNNHLHPFFMQLL
ncbi:hypothetical protein CAPTEDRAFT_130820, partial [Capitella teleta]